ncbi:MAG: DnaB-like helicase C-terminal domain-containing protein [Candidatus Omnitrophota bacterium]
MMGADTLIITEGEIDCLSFIEVGHRTVTSVPDGAPSESAKEFHTKFDFLKSAEKIIEKYKRIILAMDNDTPGKLMEAELARRIGIERCYRVEYPSACKDANESLKKYGGEKLKEIISNAKPFPVEGLFSAIDFKTEVQNLYELGSNRGLSTGWNKADENYTVKTGEVTVITGIPGMGKSTWMDNVAVNMMQNHDWKFLFFSPENWPVERHIQNLLEKVLKQPFAKHAQYTERMHLNDAIETLEIIGNYMFFVYPKEGYLKVDEILEKAKVAIFRHGVNGIVIDPWNEVDHDYDNMTEAQYLSKALSKIRMFAKRNGIHIWIIAHPKNLTKDKDGNYKPPTMYEISGGAHWRNKADNGICVHRHDFDIDETEIIIQKIRFKEVGKTGSFLLSFSRDIGVYF